MDIFNSYVKLPEGIMANLQIHYPQACCAINIYKI